MTGFVFTFSLFCTAVLNTDPAVLQRAELSSVRQLIEAVVPDARLHSVYQRPRTQQSFATTVPVSPQISSPQSQLRYDGNTVPFVPATYALAARPIRAPSAA